MDLKQMRKALHISQAEIARQMGVTPGAYAKIERKEMAIPDSRVAALAQALNVPVPVFVRMMAEDFIEELLKNITVV